MKRISFTSLLSIFMVIQLSLSYGVIGEHLEDTWLEPDAWARDHLSLIALQSEIGKCCQCSEENHQDESNRIQLPPKQQQKATEDEVSLMYFKKFITLLFNRKKLNYDSKLQIYERSIIFTLQASQLDKLDQLQDPRDLDNILTEIFENARIPYMSRHGQTLDTTTAASAFKTLTIDVFRDVLQLTKTSEVRFLLIAILVVILGWYLNHRYNIAWMTLIFGGLFLYGYLHTYLECNRELEVNKMLEIINQNKGTQDSQKDSGFFSFLKNIFSSSADAQNLKEQQQLKKSTKISLGFCRPDHVIIMYFNDIFLKYLQVLLEQCTTTLTKLKEGLPFPYNYFAGIMLICMVGYILKLTFKYILSPSAWIHLINNNHTHSARAHQPALNNTDINSHNHDRLSGDNLRMLLNAINSVPQRNNISPAVSGVEDLKEALESAPDQSCSEQDNSSKTNGKSSRDTSISSNESSPLKSQNNNVSKNIENVDPKATLKHLSEGS